MSKKPDVDPAPASEGEVRDVHEARARFAASRTELRHLAERVAAALEAEERRAPHSSRKP
jgi:hypothetical protein